MRSEQTTVKLSILWARSSSHSLNLVRRLISLIYEDAESQKMLSIRRGRIIWRSYHCQIVRAYFLSHRQWEFH
jgi:hypothetical protein